MNIEVDIDALIGALKAQREMALNDVALWQARCVKLEKQLAELQKPDPEKKPDLKVVEKADGTLDPAA